MRPFEWAGVVIGGEASVTVVVSHKEHLGGKSSFAAVETRPLGVPLTICSMEHRSVCLSLGFYRYVEPGSWEKLFC